MASIELLCQQVFEANVLCVDAGGTHMPYYKAFEADMLC